MVRNGCDFPVTDWALCVLQVDYQAIDHLFWSVKRQPLLYHSASVGPDLEGEEERGTSCISVQLTPVRTGANPFHLSPARESQSHNINHAQD